MDGPIASAVVLPDEPSPPPPKRRQSSVSEESSKRPRLEDDAKPKPVAAPVRRERGRERRLFGAVLGALSQNPSNTTAQKRRAEIEKRQLAQRRQEDEESEQRKADRIARRKEQRWKEQRRFERESMRLRHDNLLDMAHFLQTETEPRLYYKPWEMTEAEHDLIQKQIDEAHETIKRELEEYNTHEESSIHDNRRTSQNGGFQHSGQGSHVSKAQVTSQRQRSPTHNGHANSDHRSLEDQQMEDVHVVDSKHEVEEDGCAERTANESATTNDTIMVDHSKNDDDGLGEEVVEEAAEDTVIY